MTSAFSALARAAATSSPVGLRPEGLIQKGKKASAAKYAANVFASSTLLATVAASRRSSTISFSDGRSATDPCIRMYWPSNPARIWSCWTAGRPCSRQSRRAV